MATALASTRIVNIFRFDPLQTDGGRYQRFDVRIDDEQLTTVLDILLKIQKEQDPSLAFRYACRVNMCGSCGMVINGRERLACKTVVAELKGKEINIRPLNHFPVVKDLVVDMGPFFEKYKAALPFFEPAVQSDEPAVIAPDSPERRDIGLSTECIACGCCVSSCSMVYNHGDYCGPAAVNRAFTLIADSRDRLRRERLEAVLDSCYHCRTELNCTEVCPKEISPTRAIKYLQKQACLDLFRQKGKKDAAEPPVTHGNPPPSALPDSDRRRFLKKVTLGLGTAAAAAVGGVLVSAAVGPALRKTASQWVRAGNIADFKSGRISTVQVRYPAADGFYKSEKVAILLISRQNINGNLVVYNSRCTHLGCTVRWDEKKRLFMCACHGGAFNPDGSVNAGPPPRPLDRYAFKVQDESLFVEVV